MLYEFAITLEKWFRYSSGSQGFSQEELLKNLDIVVGVKYSSYAECLSGLKKMLYLQESEKITLIVNRVSFNYIDDHSDNVSGEIEQMRQLGRLIEFLGPNLANYIEEYQEDDLIDYISQRY